MESPRSQAQEHDDIVEAQREYDQESERSVDLNPRGQGNKEYVTDNNDRYMRMPPIGNGGVGAAQTRKNQLNFQTQNGFKQGNTRPFMGEDIQYNNRAPGVMPSNTNKFRQESPYRQIQDQGRKSHQQTPLASQYNTLVHEREASGVGLQNQYNQAMSSIGFKSMKNGQQYPQFQTLPPKTNQANCSSHSLSIDQLQAVQQIQSSSVCHSCSVNMRSLHYSPHFSQNSIIYSQNVPVILQQMSHQGSLNSVAQNTKYLRFELEINQTSAQSHQTSKYPTFGGQKLADARPSASLDVLFLSISDDTNPQFLYLAQIDLQAFLKIRNEQNIFVEFSAFAEKIIALLDFCIANEVEEDSVPSLNRFLCVMKNLPQDTTNKDERDPHSIIDIFEHNEFRNLLHLRLDFKKANFEESTSWLSKKLLLQRRVNIDQQQDNFELSEQHEVDLQKIQTIKQSLLALKETNNEEMKRIISEHMRQLETAQLTKERELECQKLSFQEQLSEQASELNSVISDLRFEIDSLKQQAQSQLSDLRLKEENILSRDQQVTDLKQQIDSLKAEKTQLSKQSDNQRDQISSLEKQLLQQTINKDNLVKELENATVTRNQLKNQISSLEDQIQERNIASDQLKETNLLGNEQIKALETELERNIQTIHQQNEKIEGLKDKRKDQKSEIKSLREDKLELEVQRTSLEGQVSEMDARIQKLEKDRDAQESLIGKLESKLREDQQTLLSNKSLIEYLNKSLNEAQKFTFKTLVNHKGVAEVPRDFGAASSTSQGNPQFRTSNISPLRSSIPHAAPKFDQSRFKETFEVGGSNLGSKTATPLGLTATPYQLQAQQIHGRTDSLAEILYRPQQQLTLPMTDFYHNKHNQTTAVNRHLPHRPMTASNSFNSGGNTMQHQQTVGKHFNHVLNNPFSSQLERERIISEERLKQRFDEGYQSRYQGVAAISGTSTSINAGVIALNPIFNRAQTGVDMTRTTINQTQKPAIVEEDQDDQNLVRRASSAVFNPADAQTIEAPAHGHLHYHDSKPTESKRNFYNDLSAVQMQNSSQEEVVARVHTQLQPADDGAALDDSEEEMESENDETVE